jgi:cytochrome c oxidase subunit 3
VNAVVREPEEQFDSLERQQQAATLGMWLFLGSEVLFFSALFAVYAGLRVHFSVAFREAARHTDLGLGTTNTVLLLSSSYAVALAATGPRRGSRDMTVVTLLLIAAALGLVFLGLKGLEYAHHFRDGIYPAGLYHFAELPGDGARMFFTLYYFMTGLHALHVIIGVGLLLWLARRAARGSFSAEYSTPLELGGMYWHLVDIVWLFLWPAFYLLRAHS